MKPYPYPSQHNGSLIVQPRPFPMLTFRCRVTYLTPHGKIGGAVYVVRAIAADLAVDHAETLLRSDKRRNVKQITYTEAIQL